MIGKKYILSDKFSFNPQSGMLVENNDTENVVYLGNNERLLLLMLSQNPNKVLTRDELLESVWREQGFVVETSSLTQAISVLRKFLKDSAKAPDFIKTMPKQGYKLICNVLVEDESKSKPEEENNADMQSFEMEIPDLIPSPEKSSPSLIATFIDKVRKWSLKMPMLIS